MKWRFKVMGGHTHVSVYMNGAKCGDLCFRNEEFQQIRKQNQGMIQFVEEKPEAVPF